MGKLDAIHFQAEESDVLAVANSGVCGNCHSERSLADTRTGSENNQVGILETVREFVQFRNACRHACNTAITTVIDAFQKWRHKVVDRLEGVAHLVIGNRKDIAFGILKHVIRRRSRIHRLANNIGRRADELAEYCLATEVFQLPRDIRRRCDGFHQFKDVFTATDNVELTHLRKFRRKCHGIDGGHRLVQTAKRVPNQLMTFHVEKVIVTDGHHRGAHHFGITQNTAQQAALRLDIGGHLATFKRLGIIFFRHNYTDLNIQ